MDLIKSHFRKMQLWPIEHYFHNKTLRQQESKLTLVDYIVINAKFGSCVMKSSKIKLLEKHGVEKNGIEIWEIRHIISSLVQQKEH